MIENQKKRENMEIEEILRTSLSKDRLTMGFTVCQGELIPEAAVTSFTLGLYVTRVRHSY